MKELTDFIMNELPNDGEWWSDGHQAFIELATLLRDNRVEPEIIKKHLRDIYNAGAQEFGE